ncbi:hypothetical protein [Rhodococcus sp. NPDC059234]|uniref:hypothetical protein n=1 Tax=Rhodococcus sp. NPDC059234 TaxID=3346781 RepID=UPI003671BD00
MDTRDDDATPLDAKEDLELAQLLEKILREQKKDYRNLAHELAKNFGRMLTDRTGPGLTEQQLNLARGYALLRSQLAGPTDDYRVSPARIVRVRPDRGPIGTTVQIRMRNSAPLVRVGFLDGNSGEAEAIPVEVNPQTASRTDDTAGTDQLFEVVVPETATSGPVTVRTSTDDVLTSRWEFHITNSDDAPHPTLPQ